jgi:hypothetical protein
MTGDPMPSAERALPRSLDFLKPLAIDDLARFGSRGDGGYLLPSRSIAGLDACLSFGIFDNWTFEKDLKDRVPDLLIHTYDYTVRPAVKHQELRLSIIKGIIQLCVFRCGISNVRSRIKAYREHKDFGSSPKRVGDFRLKSYRIKHAGEDLEA